MATDIGKLQKRKYIIWIHSLKKRCIKRQFTGIHDRFLRDSDFRKSMLEHDRDEDVCLTWDDLAEQDFTYRKNQNIFETNKIGGSLSISLESNDHGENVLTSTKRCLHQTVHTENLEDNN